MEQSILFAKPRPLFRFSEFGPFLDPGDDLRLGAPQLQAVSMPVDRVRERRHLFVRRVARKQGLLKTHKETRTAGLPLAGGPPAILIVDARRGTVGRQNDM